MSWKNPRQFSSSSEAASAHQGAVTSKEDTRIVAYAKVWEFFWNTLTSGEKLWILGGLVCLVCFAAVAGFWFNGIFTESKIERQAAEHLSEKTKLENEIAYLKRTLTKKPEENEITLETADPLNRSYTDFVRDLNEARSQGLPAISNLVESCRKKSVKWDCMILDGNTTEKFYRIGVNDKAERKDRAFAGFNPDKFYLRKNGERATIEGVFSTADDSGITLYDCRFAEDAQKH